MKEIKIRKEEEDCPFYTFWDGSLCIYPEREMDGEDHPECCLGTSNEKDCPVINGLLITVEREGK